MERRAREVLANIGSTRSAEIGDRNSSDVERGVAGSTSKGDARNGGGDRVEESAAQPLSSGRETASDMKDGPVTLGGKNKDGKGKTVKKGGKKERKTDEARTSEKDRWWTKIDGDCPISLIPIAELPVPPFTLKASGSSVPHYFDARFLASFLLSSFDFMNPVNRSPLNREDCVALDVHLRQFYPDSSSSVTDAYDLFQRNGGNGSDAVRREAREKPSKALRGSYYLYTLPATNMEVNGMALGSDCFSLQTGGAIHFHECFRECIPRT